MRRSLIIKYMICPLMKSNPSPLYFSSRIINMFTKMPIMPCAAYISFVLCSRNGSALMPSYFNFKTVYHHYHFLSKYFSTASLGERPSSNHLDSLCHSPQILLRHIFSTSQYHLMYSPVGKIRLLMISDDLGISSHSARNTV